MRSLLVTFVLAALLVCCVRALNIDSLRLRASGSLQGQLENRVQARLARDGVVDVYLGAMDEEAYYILAEVLKSGIYDDVICIERSQGDDASVKKILWERSISYIKGERPVNYAEVTPGTHTLNLLNVDGTLGAATTCTGGKYACSLVDNLATTLNDAVLEGKILAGEKPKSNVSKKYHVYTFGNPTSPNAPSKVAIVHRIAEMGLQPELVWPMAQPVFKAMKVGGSTNVNIIAIAAGGVTYHEDQPGSNHLLHGSFNAGYAIIGGKVKAVLKIARDAGDNQDELISSGPVLGLDNTAQAKILSPRGVAWDAETARDSIEYNARKLYQDLEARAGKDKAAPGPTSLTISFFGGAAEKSKSDSIGVHDVNMEDYYYIVIPQKVRAGAGMPTVNKVGVFRVDCDPYNVEPYVTKFNAWAATQKVMLRTELAAIIKWGLDGMNLAALPVVSTKQILLWKTYLKTSDSTELTQAILAPDQHLFIPAVPNSDQVIHPYLIEVATDLLKDTAEGKSNSNPTRAIDTPLKDLAKAAMAARTEEAITAFVNAWATYMWACRGDAKGNNDDVPEAARNTGVPIWVRAKWATYFQGDNLATTFGRAAILELFRANALGVDRTFYKASNFAGLKSLNELLFSSHRTPVDYAARATACVQVPSTADALCTKVVGLGELLAHDPQVAPIYANCGTTSPQVKSAAFYALKNFCQDDIAKMNKF